MYPDIDRLTNFCFDSVCKICVKRHQLLAKRIQLEGHTRIQLIQKHAEAQISDFFLYEHVTTGILETLGVNGNNDS